MSLKRTVAAPFRSAGGDRMERGKFVVALSLDRDWFSPDQANRVVDVATGRGLVTESGDDLVAEFDPASVTVPEGFAPDEDVLRQESTFERVLERLVDAGLDKREAVAGVNERQREIGVTAEAAALTYAQSRGVEVDDIAPAVRRDLASGDGGETD